MNQFDRNHFCIHKYESYTDKPSQLFSGQTISTPHMHAKAIEYLERKFNQWDPSGEVLRRFYRYWSEKPKGLGSPPHRGGSASKDL